MRYLLLFIFSVSALFANAQQVNPVTDYTFANKMSSGRSTVTDTAAYFSVGPRFGAIRGMMPPIVVDTAVVVANKRNGLLIFSVQKNKMQVWDSAGSKWADLTGSAGSAITSADTASMLLPYLRKVDTTAMLLPYLRKVDTTAMLLPYLRKVDTTAMLSPYLKESDTTFLSNRINLKVNMSDTSTMLSPYVRGSGTANYLPKFNASRSIVDSKVYETGTNLMFNTTTPYISSSGYGTFDINGSTASVLVLRKTDTARGYWSHNGSTMDINNLSAGDIRFYTQGSLRGRFQTDGTFRLNSLTGTGDRIVTADANGVLSATSSATGLVDTTVLSTRAWRQKGIDSVNANVALKVNISDTSSMLTNYIRHAGNGLTKSGQALSVDTAAIATRARVQKGIDSVATLATAGVTSVATGYGLSGGTITTTGTISADTLQLSTRAWRQKGLDSLAALEISGSGTAGQVAYFDGTRSITGENALFYDATNDRLGINTSSPSYRLDVSGTFRSSHAGGILRYEPETISGNLTSHFNLRAYTTYNNQISFTEIGVADRWSFGTRTGDDKLYFSQGATVSGSVRMMLNTSAELLLNTTTDAGDYKLQVSGNAYVTGAITSTSNLFITSSFPEYLAQLNTAGGQRIRMRVNGTDGEIQVTRALGTVPALLFSTEGGEKLRIENAGGIKFNPQSAAANATAGTVYYDSDDNKLKVYNGTTWVDLH